MYVCIFNNVFTFICVRVNINTRQHEYKTNMARCKKLAKTARFCAKKRKN